MKVIQTDNYDRDYVDDHLVQEGLSMSDAEHLAFCLNAKADPHGPYFFRADEWDGFGKFKAAFDYWANLPCEPDDDQGAFEAMLSARAALDKKGGE